MEEGCCVGCCCCLLDGLAIDFIRLMRPSGWLSSSSGSWDDFMDSLAIVTARARSFE